MDGSGAPAGVATLVQGALSWAAVPPQHLQLALDYPPIPPFWVWFLLVVFVLLPLLSFGLLVAFAATTKFDVSNVRLKGDSLKGILASSAARMAVGEMDSVYLPLEIVMTKKGYLPIAVHVKDVELRLSIEDEYISTITESESFVIEHGRQEFIVPVHTQVSVEGRLKRFYELFRGMKDRHYEMKVHLKGHLIVKHWFFTRSVPVTVTQYQLLRPVGPTVRAAAWTTNGAGARLTLELWNPLREAAIKGELEVALVRDRLLLPDRETERRKRAVEIEAGKSERVEFDVRDADGDGGRGLYPVIYFGGDRIWPGFMAKESPRSGNATVRAAAPSPAREPS